MLCLLLYLSDVQNTPAVPLYGSASNRTESLNRLEYYDEERLKAKCGEGDSDAMVLLWNAHRELVSEKTYAYLENKLDVLDIRSIVKKKFLTALRKNSIQGKCANWLSSVIHNACMDKFRQDKQHLEMLGKIESWQLQQEPDEVAETKKEMAWEAVEKVLENYAIEDQYLIIAFYIQGKKASELAAVYQKSDSFVYEKTKKFLGDVRKVLGLVNRN